MIANADAIDADVLRIRHEFQAKPELVLSVAQVAGLYELSTAHAKRLLETLEAEGFLVSGPAGAYQRSAPTTRD